MLRKNYVVHPSAIVDSWDLLDIPFATTHKSDKWSEQLQPSVGQKTVTENPAQYPLAQL